MRNADRPSDAPEGEPELCEFEGMGLLLAPFVGALPGSFPCGSASEFALRDVRSVPSFPKKHGRSFPPMVVRSHVAWPAKGYKILERMIARETKRLDVMNV